MYFPSLEEFREKAKEGNLIPVYKEIMADMETPVTAFLKIDTGNYSFLLESVERGEKWARYSFLGSNPSIDVYITEVKKPPQSVALTRALWDDIEESELKKLL